MKAQMIPFGGGIITEGPLLTRNPGTLLTAINYEIPPAINPNQTGYRRINGYVLYDGSEVPVPVDGSGDIRGLFIYKDELYAIRDNVNGSAGVIWKESPSGWVEINNSLPPGGHYEFVINNFYGASDNIRVYGVNSVGKAFMFDGTTVTFITTGMAIDKPNHIASFRNFLFLSFPGGSVQHSAAGNPESWSPILGAAELAVGDQVTGFSVEVSDTLVIFTRNKKFTLTGTGAIIEGGMLDWILKVYSSDSGAHERTIQRLGQTIFNDDRGLFQLQSTDRFGDFNSMTLSTGFRFLLTGRVKNGIACSMVIREKNQYRIFFNDKSVLSCTFSGDDFLGATTFEYPIQVTSCTSGEVEGIEKAFIGDQEGNIYHIDKGNSFNGVPIRSYLRPQYYHYGDMGQRKLFRRIHLEIDSESEGTLYVEPDYDYSSLEVSKSILYEYTMGSTGGSWNSSNWDEFVWAVPLARLTPLRIQGVGVNMSMLFFHESASDAPFTVFGIVVDYDKRGRTR